MSRYTIRFNGTAIGTFDGSSPAEALQAANDAEGPDSVIGHVVADGSTSALTFEEQKAPPAPEPTSEK